MNDTSSADGTPTNASARIASLDRMFRAESVAVVGASSDPAKIGGKPIALTKAHFHGRLTPVNPNRDTITGLECAPEIGGVAPPPDLAIVAVPAPAAEAAIGACLERGIRAIVLFTAGFAETGAQGLAAQERIAAACTSAGARLLGPNSLGFIDFRRGLYATFSAALDNVWPRPGNVGIASQSGAVGSYIMALAAERGVGFSHFIATGNEADVDVADCIAWMACDPNTSVIVAYLEGCRDGDRLRTSLALAASVRKPVIAIKPGATDTGFAAVKSHTGMLAGSKRVFDAVLEACGAWSASSIEEAVDIAYACAPGKLPAGSGAGIVTPSGGAGIMLADACEESGLTLPSFSKACGDEVRKLLPLASIDNPLDTTAQVANDLRLFGKVIEIAASGSDMPILLVFMAHMGRTPGATAILSPILKATASRFPERLMVLTTRAADDFRADMEGCGFLVFEDPTRAVRAVGALAWFARCFARKGDGPVTTAPVDAERIEAAAGSATAAAKLLARIGIPGPTVLPAATEEAAVRAAAEIGYPVVLKIDSADITHKTDIGGVHLDLRDEASVRAAWRAMLAGAREGAPGASVSGGIVAPMIEGGVETIVGTWNDPDFGPVVMVGMGGVMAEALDDVAIAPAPVSLPQAHRMIGALRAGKLLDGWRGAARCDRNALARAICALAAFAHANAGMIESVEVNPLRVLPTGVAALDVLVQLRGSGSRDVRVGGAVGGAGEP